MSVLSTPFVTIVSGLSGAGKTVTLRTLEDNGFFCVDNLPLSLIDNFIRITTANAGTENIGIGIDIREQEFLAEADFTIQIIRKKYNLHMLFLEAETDVLIRRYKETRRPHPLSRSTGENIVDAIESERAHLTPLMNEADRIIDTSSLTPHQLRNLVASTYGKVSNTMRISIMSFGFKYGTPQNLDMLFDVRFLPNPHFVTELRSMTGLDSPVREYVFKEQVTLDFIRKIDDLMDFLIPHYIKEGKAYLIMGIGCTGGRHRSPAIAEKIGSVLRKHNIALDVVHREI